MPGDAFLLLQTGDGDSQEIRLRPGQRCTIGRAPHCTVVLQDNRCSREHAALAESDGRWRIRDLGSRNGTAVRDRLVREETSLESGDMIRIGQCCLTFFEENASEGERPLGGDTASGEPFLADGDRAGETRWARAEIFSRRGTTRYLLGEVTPDRAVASRRVADRAALLCGLAFHLGKADSLEKILEIALAGVLEAVGAEVGAMLVPVTEGRIAEKWKVLHANTPEGAVYEAPPDAFIDNVVEGVEAVLCSSTSRDAEPQAEQARQMICAPVRNDEKLMGMLHLYSTGPGGAYDEDDLEFVLAVANTVAVALENVGHRDALEQSLTKIRGENDQLRRQLDAEYRIVGSSPAMQRVHELIEKAASSKATLLVRGESGVGKELVARAVHQHSDRRDGPLVCLNCAALSEDLLASELFGHERGAFTGATDRKIGKFEAAHQGTLVLDEIGEMSPAIQAKFLRVLEGHPFERVGGNEAVNVDVRVVAATNRDLEREVAERRFRRDLFFRLRVLDVVIPPLRERPDDVEELAQHFLSRYVEETGRPARAFEEKALRCLREYHWPGNVRELKNVIERAVLFASGERITSGDLLLSTLGTPGDTDQTPAARPFEPLTLAELEHRHIETVLARVNWNKSRASSMLGIERSTLDRKIRRYGIERPD